MGRAMLEGWIEKKLNLKISVIDPGIDQETRKHFQDKNIHFADAASDIESQANIIVLAVKPQILTKAAEQTRPLAKKSAIVISIAAGQRIETLESVYGDSQPIIRTMPNTPAAIGEGIIIGASNPYVSKDHKEQARELLEPLGFFDWVEEENQLDAVTAISGSGPAYVFLFMQALEKAANKLGLAPDLADRLARQTVRGASILATSREETSLEDLRKAVTSPGGTTEAALHELMDENTLFKLVEKAAKAAENRAGELSEDNKNLPG